ncbi:MAG: hypothetical protein LBI78_07335 [Campylobacteraceae bacterium]|nr:hypothetical protein [Campylobacteraceae bacterium]
MKIVAIALLSICALTFSGCSEKLVTITVLCEIETPARLYNDKVCEGNYSEVAKCILIKKEALIVDYNNLLSALEGCK